MLVKNMVLSNTTVLVYVPSVGEYMSNRDLSIRYIR